MLKPSLWSSFVFRVTAISIVLVITAAYIGWRSDWVTGQRLIGAVKRRDYAWVEHMLQTGRLSRLDIRDAFPANPIGNDTFGMTPLLWAVENDDRRMIRLLACAGACLETPHPLGHTPLWWATLGSKFEAIIELSKLGAQLDVRDIDGRTPLMAVSMHGNHDAAAALIESGANLSAADKTGNAVASCLIIGFRDQAQVRDELIMSMVMRGLSPDARIAPMLGDDRTLLMFASEFGSVSFVQFLLDRKACVLLRCSNGDDAIAFAAKRDGHDKNIVVCMLQSKLH